MSTTISKKSMLPTTGNTADSPYSPYSKHRGPHPGIVAVVFVTLFIASLVLYAILSQGAGFPMPFGSREEAARLFRQFPDAVRVNAFLQFGAAIPLGIFTAAVTSRLQFLGVNVTGVSIAMFGGTAAAVLVILSALAGWILSQPGITDDLLTMHVLQLIGMLTGGVAHITMLGLLMAGVSIPCLFGKYTPRWLAWLGIILAGLAELSVLSLVFFPLTVLLPVVRFTSYVWMIGTGFRLTKSGAGAAQ